MFTQQDKDYPKVRAQLINTGQPDLTHAITYFFFQKFLLNCGPKRSHAGRVFRQNKQPVKPNKEIYATYSDNELLFVKRRLGEMALLKMNTLHCHLTGDHCLSLA